MSRVPPLDAHWSQNSGNVAEGNNETSRICEALSVQYTCGDAESYRIK